MKCKTDGNGTITDGFHPAAESALSYLNKLGYKSLIVYQESFASCAIEGNELAEICSNTLHRCLKGDPVSDRYLLGLAWTIRSMEEDAKPRKRRGKHKML